MISEFLKGRVQSFQHAFDGLKILWPTEINIRIHSVCTGLAVLAGILFRISGIEWVAVVLVIGAVWSAETFNSAIERAVDLSTLEQRPLAKQAKDLAAAAVLIAAITSVIVGLIIFLPKVLSF